MRKTYSIEYPIVAEARDYHEFNDMCNTLTKALGETIAYHELGFGELFYWAAFYPASTKIDNEQLDKIRRDMFLE